MEFVTFPHAVGPVARIVDKNVGWGELLSLVDGLKLD